MSKRTQTAQTDGTAALVEDGPTYITAEPGEPLYVLSKAQLRAEYERGFRDGMCYQMLETAKADREQSKRRAS